MPQGCLGLQHNVIQMHCKRSNGIHQKTNCKMSAMARLLKNRNRSETQMKDSVVRTQVSRLQDGQKQYGYCSQFKNGLCLCTERSGSIKPAPFRSRGSRCHCRAAVDAGGLFFLCRIFALILSWARLNVSKMVPRVCDHKVYIVGREAR